MTSFWKGKKLSKEHREKMSIAGKLKVFTLEHRKNISKSKMGVKATLETIEKLSISHKGQHSSKATEFKKGDKRISGENNPNWKGGVTSLNEKIRKSGEYKDWRIAVFKRDDYTCQECGSRGVTLHADHVKPFAYFPELRLVISNGRTLCVPCHKTTDTYGRKIKNYNIKKI